VAKDTTIQDFEQLPTFKQEEPEMPPKRRRWWLLLLPGLVFALLVVAIILKLQPKPAPQAPLPSPTPTSTPTPEEVFTSPWATDSAVLKIDADLVQLETDLNQVNLQEPNLLPPPIQLKLEFELP